MTIRNFIPADLDDLLHLFFLNVPVYFAESEAEDYRRYLQNDAENYWVLEIAGKIVGAGGINILPAEKLGCISWDILHPSHQRKGYGKQLLEHRICILLSTPGVESIIVRTAQRVYGFYENSGFVLQSIEKDFWAKGYDMYYMRYEPREKPLKLVASCEK